MRSRLSTQQVLRGSLITGLIGSTVLLPLIATTPASAAVNLCGHPADTVPPHISSVTFSPSASTTHGTTTVTLTADATDTATSGAGSGVKHLEAYFTGPHYSYVEVKFALSSGTTANGVWTGAATFTQKDWPGAYHLRDVSISDAANNYEDYPGYGTSAAAPTAISLQSGWDSQLTLTGPTPTKTKPSTVPAGKVSSFTLSPTAVNTTKSAKRVNVTATFAGHQPRHAYASFFRPPTPGGSRRFIELTARLKHVGHSWRGHIIVPRWVGDMKPQLTLDATFGHGFKPEYRQYNYLQLKARGFASSLDVTSTVDPTAPVLTNLAFTPSSVNTTTGKQTVAITATAADPESGVRRIDVSFDKSTNLGIVFGDGSNPGGATAASGLGGFGENEDGGDVTVRLTRTGSHWTGTATFRECVPIGKWHVSAFLVDHADNVRYLNGTKLAKLGFPSTLQVAAAPQYVFDPVVVAATAAGAYNQITLDFDEGVQNLTTSNLTAYAMSPAANRYQTPLTITSIACSNGKAVIDCSGSGGLVTSAVLTIPAVTGGRQYEVWADLDTTATQITDAGGLPVSWQYAIAQVQGR